MLDAQARQSLQDVLGHTFRDVELLDQALRHSSTANGTGTDEPAAAKTDNNERLEFLGDAVLGLIVCHILYVSYPGLREGDMTKIKSHAVSRETCGLLARQLGLDQHLMLGRGMQSVHQLPSSVAAAALESVIGAIYLDGGFEAAQKFVTPLFGEVIRKAARSGHQQNFKSVLQQYAQQVMDATPAYRILDEQGPDHQKCFKIVVDIAGQRFGPCWGATKKKAEQDAALHALRELGVVRDGADGELLVVLPDAE